MIERIHEDSMGSSTVTNVLLEGKLQSQTVEHRRTDAKTSGGKDWARWTYDGNGRLSEYRAGQDKEERNHYLNFKYDSNGRLLGCEYRQSGGESPFSFMEVTYSGNSVDESTLDEQRRKIYEQVQVMDGSNRVIDLKVSDGNPLKLWYHVTFKYDEYWSERRRWFTPADGSPRIMTRAIRQNVTYR